jgi:hypothetical protein
MCAENLATPSKLDPQDREAAAVLRLLGKLYAVEKEAREAGATHEQAASGAAPARSQQPLKPNVFRNVFSGAVKAPLRHDVAAEIRHDNAEQSYLVLKPVIPNGWTMQQQRRTLFRSNRGTARVRRQRLRISGVNAP